MSNVIIGGTASGATALSLYPGTVDGVNDLIPIYDNSTGATVASSRNTYLNIASQPVGLSDTQTLTNKTLTSPTISGPTLSGTIAGTYTIGGTPTFPSSVVQLASTQTLTNKTLTSPTINSPTITNATLTADTISGYTSGSSGTIYGIGVTSGVITGAGTVGSAALATNAVQASQIATNAITLGYAQITSNFTITSASAQYITGLSVNVTIPSGGRKVKVTVFLGGVFNTTAADGCVVNIYSGASSGALTTQLTSANIIPATNITTTCISVATPSAGSIYYTASVAALTTAAGTVYAGATQPGFILVEAI